MHPVVIVLLYIVYIICAHSVSTLTKTVLCMLTININQNHHANFNIYYSTYINVQFLNLSTFANL